MTRADIERLLHCARHEAQGAGPNTLAEVCEWALERAVTCDRIANEMRKRCEAAERKLERAGGSESCPHGMRTPDVCYECQAIRAEAAEAALVRAQELQRGAEAQHCAALARVGELEKLAYLGEHHFPDLTHKARLEELVPVLRATESRAEAAEAKLAKAREALTALLNRITSEPTMSGHLRNMRLRPDHDGSHHTSDAIRAARAALSDKEPPPKEPRAMWHSAARYVGWLPPDEVERRIAEAESRLREELTAPCHGLGCGRCEDCVQMARDEALEDACSVVVRAAPPGGPAINRDIRALKSKKEMP